MKTTLMPAPKTKKAGPYPTLEAASKAKKERALRVLQTLDPQKLQEN